MTAAPSALQIAERVRDGMYANDHAAQALGITVQSIGPGCATLTMTVRPDMVNGHDICHGGLIATLADTAFAYACNAYNEVSVASGFAIDLLAPGKRGDVLVARCHEVSKTGRAGVYDVEVSRQDGTRIAVFRGRSHTFRGKPVVVD